MMTLCTLDGPPLPGESAQERTVTSPDGEVTVTARFVYPPGPTGITAGYTAPTIRWGESTIEGLVDDVVITFRSPWAQSSRPEHHNFGDNFIFEPRADPDVHADVIAALDAQDVAVVTAFAPM